MPDPRARELLRQSEETLRSGAERIRRSKQLIEASKPKPKKTPELRAAAQRRARARMPKVAASAGEQSAREQIREAKTPKQRRKARIKQKIATRAATRGDVSQLGKGAEIEKAARSPRPATTARQVKTGMSGLGSAARKAGTTLRVLGPIGAVPGLLRLHRQVKNLKRKESFVQRATRASRAFGFDVPGLPRDRKEIRM